jgi:hypothetical protein
VGSKLTFSMTPWWMKVIKKCVAPAVTMMRGHADVTRYSVISSGLVAEHGGRKCALFVPCRQSFFLAPAMRRSPQSRDEIASIPQSKTMRGKRVKTKKTDGLAFGTADNTTIRRPYQIDFCAHKRTRYT